MTLEREILRAQDRIFRLAERDHGLTLKSISLDSGIPYETLRSYRGNKGAQSMMPVSALVRLAGVIPDILLSHLLDPADRHLVPNDDDDELDDLGDRADEVAREVRRARHPNSPGGTEIVAIEEERIKRLARGLKRKAA
jgi:hypothetical protein